MPMKIHVQCKSALLQRALEMFLAPNLSTYKQSDMVLRDHYVRDEKKPYYLISSKKDADIQKPFTRSYLVQFLEKKYKELGLSSALEGLENSTEEPLLEERSFDILEKRIELLTLEYQKNIINAVKAFYEK